jgi:hypothetical protein
MRTCCRWWHAPAEPLLRITNNVPMRQTQEEQGWQAVPELILAAAAAIAGKPDPDDRLISIVVAAVPWIRTNDKTRKAVPARDALRRRLKAVRRAASTLSRELENWHQNLDKQPLVFLLEDGGLDRPTINVLAEALPRLSDAAAAAPTPEPAHGQRALPNSEALTPLEQCAALVAFGWHRARGELPPHTSTAACRFHSVSHRVRQRLLGDFRPAPLPTRRRCARWPGPIPSRASCRRAGCSGTASIGARHAAD